MTPTLELRKLIRELASITGPETTGVALVAVSDGEIKVRTFGEREPLHKDLKTVAEALGGER